MLKPSGVWCMGLLSIILGRMLCYNFQIGKFTEVSHDSARDFFSDNGVGVFFWGTFTEGSVKISPIFRRGIFMRLHCWNNGTVSL